MFNFMYFAQSLEACFVGLLLGYLGWSAAEMGLDNAGE